MDLRSLGRLFLEKANKADDEIIYLQEQVKFYEEAISDLENGKISSVAKNIVYTKYRLEVNKKNISQILSTLKTDIFVIKERIKLVDKRYKECRTVYECLEYRQVLYPYLIDFIKDELMKEKYDSVELIKIMEKIKIFNANIEYYQNKRLRSRDLHLILNMLNQGYEDIPESESSLDLDNFLASLKQMIMESDIDNLETIFELTGFYEYITKSSDLRYVYSELLRFLQRKIYELISILKNTEYYFDIENLQEIKNEYKVLYEKYMFVRNKLDEVKVISEDIEEEQEIKEEVINKLYYASNSSDPSKCYFIRDLHLIREESLEKSWELLSKFKRGEAVSVKRLNYNRGSFIELRFDQVRIILKPMNERNYAVLGIFIKKSDNLKQAYDLIFDRPIPEINDEYSFLVEEKIDEYVKTNSRKGSR